MADKEETPCVMYKGYSGIWIDPCTEKERVRKKLLELKGKSYEDLKG